MLELIKHLKERRFVVIAAILGFAVLVAACQPASLPTATAIATTPPTEEVAVGVEGCTPSGEVKRGGELKLARLEEPLTMDPVGPSDNGSIYLIEQVFESLTEPGMTRALVSHGGICARVVKSGKIRTNDPIVIL